VFEHLQHAQIVRIKIEAVSLDSTVIKVHPDGTGTAAPLLCPSSVRRSGPLTRRPRAPGRLDRNASTMVAVRAGGVIEGTEAGNAKCRLTEPVTFP
jgi:hypothetical protein